MSTEKNALESAIKLLIEIKKKACHTRRFAEPAGARATASSKCLFGIEGDVEEFLNDMALADPSLAAPWKMTPDFAADNGVSQ